MYFLINLRFSFVYSQNINCFITVCSHFFFIVGIVNFSYRVHESNPKGCDTCNSSPSPLFKRSKRRPIFCFSFITLLFYSLLSQFQAMHLQHFNSSNCRLIPPYCHNMYPAVSSYHRYNRLPAHYLYCCQVSF